jgi:hypothetical protein
MMTCGERGRTVVWALEELRVHPALQEIGFCAFLPELNEATRSQNRISPQEPIFVTHTGLILSGFGCWRSAVFDRQSEINCIEYPLSEDESLHFILTHHQTRQGWNDFVRIRSALTLAPALQQRALDNMSAGGKLKGLANLPDPHHVNVRKEIARAAGVGDRNVSNVRKILETAHPRLIEALQNGTLKISRAMQFCDLPKAEQLEQFVRYSEERAIYKVIRRAVPQPKAPEATLDVVAVLDALQHQEERQPGSVAVRAGRLKRTVVLIGQDLLAAPPSQKVLKRT